MAAWQFDFHLIPRDSAVHAGSEVPAQFQESQSRDVNWWAGSSALVPEMRKRFSSLLPQAASWSDRIEKWGDDDGDRIDLVRDEAGIVDVFVRIDVRQLSKPFIGGLITVCRSLDCVLFTEQQEVIASEEAVLLRAISKSEAARFVDDPRDFLDNLQRES